MAPTPESDIPLIPIGISSCLIGEAVRFNGGHKKHNYIVETLGKFFEFHSFCPEVTIGLGVPRDPIRLVRDGETTRSVGVKDPTLDVTEALEGCADQQVSWQRSIYGYILKKGSPSCGMERVKRYRNDIPEADGIGIFAGRMMQNLPHLPVEEEGRLNDPVLRENFIQRVFAYRSWRQLASGALDINTLTRFHAQHKLTLMSHNQDRARSLGKFLANTGELSAKAIARRYIDDFSGILKIPASRKNHVNVLQHIQGYLKKQLTADDKLELTEIVEQYRLGQLPLIVPITLLRHHFRNYPDPYISASYYMNPHPQELMLLNHI